MSCPFTFCDDLSCNNYCACGIMYVSLNTFRNIFKFKTTEIENNSLNNNVLTTTSADIIYYVDSSSFPDINSAHAMMDVSGSQDIVLESTNRYSNLIKHDFLFYIAKENWGNAASIGLYSNVLLMKNNIEDIGWSVWLLLKQKLINADNSGNGLTNDVSNNASFNFSKRMLEQIKYFDADRLNVDISYNPSGGEVNGHILDTSGVQSIPLKEGDSCNFFIKLASDGLDDRIYRVKLLLTNDVANVNTQPNDSIANTSGYSHILSDGVP